MFYYCFSGLNNYFKLDCELDTMLRFYNTLTKKKEAFRPLHKGSVTMYNCGLTVYDYAHIGNLRAFMLADLLRRYLEYRGFRVRQVMNFTDVGHMTVDDVADGKGQDKIEMSAKKQHKSPYEIAEFYIEEYLKDSRVLNMLEPEKRPRATKHIKEMKELIARLFDKGYAYQAGNSVYYDVSKFKGYGKLSGNRPGKLRAGARIAVRKEKKHPYDFALWKRDPKHLMQWDSPWGRGFPGWHIECSAMSMKYLGETIDIHTGGEDNIFPHHECEIAQSEAATGKHFVRFWLHTRHLMVEGEKMSKSKGNFYTLHDLLKKGFGPRAIRYLLLSAHYRTKLNFTEGGIGEAEQAIRRFEEFLENTRTGKDNMKTARAIARAKKDFESAMNDDLNISKALAAIFNFMREVNRVGGGHKARKAILDFDRVLGLGLSKQEARWMAPTKAEPAVRKAIAGREDLRKQGKWKDADKIRTRLKKKGIILEDTKDGPRWKRVKQ